MSKLKNLPAYNAYPVPLADIYVDSDFNCRGLFTQQSVLELSRSIESRGLDIPVTLRPFDCYEAAPALDTKYEYHLVTGHRRFEAVKMLGQSSIPAVLRELDDRSARVLNLQENIERKTLDILQEAKALQAIYPFGVTLKRAADDLNRPTRWVHARLRLLKLPEEVQTLAASGLISAQNIDRLATMQDAGQQIEAAQALVVARQKSKSSDVVNGLAPQFRDSFKARRSKDQILKMLVRILDQNVVGIEAKVASWAAGYIEDDALHQEIDNNGLGARLARIEKHLGIETT
jgi:ParB/RepB/Spo0J family partition protein